MKPVASVRLGAQDGARRRLGVIAGLLFTVWSGAAMAQNAYVPNFSSNNVSVINTATNAVVATVVVGTRPYGAAVTPDGTRAYVTNQNSNTVSVINTATNAVVATVPTMSEWAMILFGLILAGGAALYVQRRQFAAWPS